MTCRRHNKFPIFRVNHCDRVLPKLAEPPFWVWFLDHILQRDCSRHPNRAAYDVTDVLPAVIVAKEQSDLRLRCNRWVGAIG